MKKPAAPPHNIEAEQSVLGAMLITPGVIPAVVERLSEPDFYRDSHRLIYQAILELEEADPITLTEHLKAKGKLKSSGGADYIHTLVNLCHAASNAPQYAEIVKENSVRRSVIQEAQEKIQLAEEGGELPELTRQRLEKQAVGILLSEVEPEHITWLFHGRVAYGKLTVLEGGPGQGKSTLAFDIAARVSRGTSMPDGSGGDEPAGVVILSSEDGLRDTIRLRLEAAGADLEKILVLNTCPDNGGGHPPVLPDDLNVIEKAIERVDAKLVIIDPLSSYMGGTNTHKDSEVRGVLSRVAELAENTGAGFLVIRHLNKMTGGKAIYRGGGSIGIIGQARSGLLAANDPDSSEDDKRHVLASQKCNNTVKPESLAYRIEEAVVDYDGEQYKTSRIVWDGTSSHDADSLLAQVDGEEKTALEEAMEVLESILTDGRIQVDEVKKQYRQAGISDATARRAKEALKVKSVHPVIPGPWYWELPRCSKNPQDVQDSLIENLEHLEHLGESKSPEPELERLKNQGRLSV